MKASARKELERTAEAFLADTEGPHASERLREFGAQRAWAKAESLKATRSGLRSARVTRNPALLRNALIACLALALVMMLSTTGAYALSYGAQPDSPLYGAKIFFERARIALTASSLEDARLEMEYSGRRIQEIESLVSRGSERGSERWLREYERNLRGATDILESALDEEATSLSLRFQEELDSQVRRMESLHDGEPARLAESIAEARRVCERERERMRRRCGMEGGGQGGGHGQEGGGGRENGEKGPGCSSSPCEGPDALDANAEKTAPEGSGMEQGPGEQPATYDAGTRQPTASPQATQQDSTGGLSGGSPMPTSGSAEEAAQHQGQPRQGRLMP